MDWITDHIAIGNCLEAQDQAVLRCHGIRSALSLDGTLSSADAFGLGLAEVVCARLVDGPGNDFRLFCSAIESLRHLAGSSPPVLVQCHAGRSRSVAVVAGYLMQAHGIGPQEAVKRIADQRPIRLATDLEALLFDLE